MNATSAKRPARSGLPPKPALAAVAARLGGEGERRLASAGWPRVILRRRGAHGQPMGLRRDAVGAAISAVLLMMTPLISLPRHVCAANGDNQLRFALCLAKTSSRSQVV